MEQTYIDRAIDEILEGKPPEVPALEIQEQLEGLRQYSDEELELMLQDPSIGTPANRTVRDEAIKILTERKGATYVNGLIEGLEGQVAGGEEAWVAEALEQDPDKSAAERAREAFRRCNNPLANLLPDSVREFVMDSSGAFYLELDNVHQVELQEFDLVLDQCISGVMEPDYIRALQGVYAVKDIYTERVQIAFKELVISGNLVTISTDHPLASTLQMSLDALITIR